MKRDLEMSSAAVVIGALRLKVHSTFQPVLGKQILLLFRYLLIQVECIFIGNRYRTAYSKAGTEEHTLLFVNSIL